MITQSGTKYHVNLSGSITQVSKDMILEPTRKTPFVKFSEDEKILSIKGNSIEVDMHNFYHPVVSRTRTYLSGREKLRVHLFFNSINTSTVKVLFDLFKFFRNKNNEGADIQFVWAAEAGSPDIMETGRDFSELYNLNFKFLSI